MHTHFDAFEDIAWDDPAYAIDPTDPRWILPEAHVLGAHPWYRALPQQRQVEIGFWSMAQMMRVGRSTGTARAVVPSCRRSSATSGCSPTRWGSGTA